MMITMFLLAVVILLAVNSFRLPPPRRIRALAPAMAGAGSIRR